MVLLEGREAVQYNYVVGRGAGEATKNVGASISDQVLVNGQEVVTYHSCSQKRIMPKIKLS